MMTTTQTTAATLTATWTRLRDGSWGLRVASEDVRSGETVTATRSNGSTSREIVGRIVWSGQGATICTIGQAAAPARTLAQRSRYRMGSGRGSAAQVAGYSGYCTDRPSCRCYDCAS
jgi:hypothetical protein